MAGNLSNGILSSSDIATLSIIGNDFKSGLIITTRYTSKSHPQCEEVLAQAEALSDSGDDTTAGFLHEFWTRVIQKSTKPQLTIY